MNQYKYWRAVAKQALDSMGVNNVGTLAAGVAYYGVLSFFPLVAAIVAISSLALGPTDLDILFDVITSYMPPDIANLLTTQLATALGKDASNAFVALFALGVSLFGIGGVVENLIRSLNVAHRYKETRTIVRLKLTSIVLTLLFSLGALLVAGLLVLGEHALLALGLQPQDMSGLTIVRWMIIGAVALSSIVLIYRFGPNHDRRMRISRRWITPGSLVAVSLWLLVTGLFFVYLQYFSYFSASYSLFAGIIALMIWLQLSATAVIFGAEIDHALTKKA